MKIKVSVPTEPVCTIKLELEEARALLGCLTMRDDIAPMDVASSISTLMIAALAKELGIDLEESLFDEQEGQ